MKLEDQCVSLELARRLKEIGVEQKSYFWWSEFRNESSPKEQWANIYSEILDTDEKKDYWSRAYLKDQKFYSAFTFSELIEIFPADLIIKETDKDFGDQSISYRLMIQKLLDGWSIYYYEKHDDLISFDGKKLVDETAKMLIHLIENGLMELG